MATYPIKFVDQLRQHLRALRKRRGLTQVQLGALLGVSQSRIAEIEANPGAVTLDKLIQLLSALEAGLSLTDMADTANHVNEHAAARLRFPPTQELMQSTLPARSDTGAEHFQKASVADKAELQKCETANGQTLPESAETRASLVAASTSKPNPVLAYDQLNRNFKEAHGHVVSENAHVLSKVAQWAATEGATAARINVDLDQLFNQAQASELLRFLNKPHTPDIIQAAYEKLKEQEASIQAAHEKWKEQSTAVQAAYEKLREQTASIEKLTSPKVFISPKKGSW